MIHDMSVPERHIELAPRDGGDNWAAHRDRTRRAIIDSFLDMLVNENPSTVSMPAVARRAGVSTRTLYRYFPNKDALMEAASTHLDADLRDALGGEPNIDNLVDYLRELWGVLAANIPGVWVQQTNPTGREVRRRRLELRRAQLTDELGDQLPPDRRDDTIDLIIAVMSSSMMLELVDRMGHSPDHAAELAGNLARLAFEHASSTHETTTAQGAAP